MFCCIDAPIGLSRQHLWELLVQPDVRQLWQQDVRSAELKQGFHGGKGSTLLLEVKHGKSITQIDERVTRSRRQDSIVMVQHWPQHQIHNKFILTATPGGLSRLTLQKRYRGQTRFALLGRQLTRRQLENSAEQEIEAIKRLGLEIANRMTQPLGLDQAL